MRRLSDLSVCSYGHLMFPVSVGRMRLNLLFQEGRKRQAVPMPAFALLSDAGSASRKQKPRAVRLGALVVILSTQKGHLMNNISAYFGKGQRSSATMVSSLSTDSRRVPSAVKICSRACLACW